GCQRSLRARPARLQRAHTRERQAAERAALQLFPHDDLLRPDATEGKRGHDAAGEPLRRCRREAAARAAGTACERRDGDRRRRQDLPRPARAGARRPDAEEGAAAGDARPGAVAVAAAQRQAPHAVPARATAFRRELLEACVRHADPRLQHQEGLPGSSADLFDGEHGLLGRRGDELGSGAGPGRGELHPVDPQAAVLPLLLGRALAHGRAAGERRNLLGREQRPGHAVERDDARDRARAAAAAQVGFAGGMAESRTIGVFGAGWVGLVTGGCFAELGHNVIVRDVVPDRIAALQAGRVPFHEPELPEVLARNRERITYTLDPAELSAADALFICVQTPPTYSGDADLSYVWSALDDLPRVERRQVLVMKSTVPVGTGDKVRAALEARGLTNVGYVSNPEFLAEGNAVRDFLNPDRIVIGSFADEDGATVEALYAVIEAPIVRTDVASAEMIKLAANAFLMTRISFINEIANVCEAVGADVVEVAEGVGLDHRLGPHFLRAGIGYG